MREPLSLRGYVYGWLFSAAFTIGLVATMPSAVSAACNYGWCGGGDPGACGGPSSQWPPVFVDSYYEGGDCWSHGEVCYQYICWYYVGDYPEGVCDNSDVWSCSPM